MLCPKGCACFAAYPDFGRPVLSVDGKFARICYQPTIEVGKANKLLTNSSTTAFWRVGGIFFLEGGEHFIGLHAVRSAVHAFDACKRNGEH